MVEASKIVDDLSNTNLAYLGFDYSGMGWRRIDCQKLNFMTRNPHSLVYYECILHDLNHSSCLTLALSIEE